MGFSQHAGRQSVKTYS